jgi:hypothetical protein
VVLQNVHLLSRLVSGVEFLKVPGYGMVLEAVQMVMIGIVILQCIAKPGTSFPLCQDTFPVECRPAEHVHQDNCHEQTRRNYEQVRIA